MMTIITAVSRQYRRLTDRLAATEWTRLGAAVVAVQLATALWWLYIELLAFDGDHDISTLAFGIADLGDAIFAGLVIGTFLAPILVAAYLLLSRILPIRRVYAQTAVPWLLLGPGVVLALIGYGLSDWGLEAVRTTFEAEGWEYAERIGLWFLYTGLLAAFAGGAFAFVTSALRPSERQRRVLVVAVAVLVAVPVVAGAVFPTANQLPSGEDLAVDNGPVEVNGTKAFTEKDRYGGAVDDPATYDNGRLSPFIRLITPLEDETDALTVASDPRLPTPNETVRQHPIAETHTNPDIQVSEVNATVGNVTVVPEARYHLDFEGANTSYERVIALDVYGEVEADGHNDDVVQPDVWTGSTLKADGGFYVEMERTESAHVYADLVTDEGEVHRYVVELERADV